MPKEIIERTRTDTYLTYREIGTTVFRTMAYEKKTKRAITAAPPAGSGGTRLSHGRKILKC